MKSLHRALLLVCLLLGSGCHVARSSEVRMITMEELAPKTGKDGSDIWLSIMGEIYDVTAGREHYEPGTAYNAFAGNDSSVPYCTGTFTAEEAEKSPNTLDDKSLKSLLSWVQFYRDSDKYPLKGYLIDPRYYDEEGNPTQEMLMLQARMTVIEEEKARKKAERARRKAEKQKKAEL